jgi:hypothetical protein
VSKAEDALRTGTKLIFLARGVFTVSASYARLIYVSPVTLKMAVPE